MIFDIVVGLVLLTIGWTLPQPAFMKPITGFISKTLKLDQFGADKTDNSL